MRRFLLLAAFWLASSAWAGQFKGDTYIGERFGRIELLAPGNHWLVLDREFSGNNEFGGPVVDLRSTVGIAGIFPSVHISAFKRADASVTAEFVLQTSRDAVLQKGGEPGPVEIRAVNGKKAWFFEAQVKQQEKPARLYYVLLAGATAFFALQTVVPESVFIETKRQVDELLLKVGY